MYAQKHRVVSRNDVSSIIERHLLPSFYFVSEIKKSLRDNQNILDLGSGAGFPAIVISLCFNQNHTTMIDSIRKKTLFLSKIVSMNTLNAKVINSRLEEFIAQSKIHFPILTARALADLDTLIKWTYPLLKKGAELHTLKGYNFREEISETGNLEIDARPIMSNWIDRSKDLANKMYIRLRLKDV
ncbi:MAG: 16S rRNA (guanine(527)-N(7))-methyltransferase RsmG [Calditrichae bacterium]|nr:16S rRNA (guanine(527)-N(7))-methyltransferase RsmG [Calditrichota bacterium]MCB9057667.1 16S rRNA (guanine(527)-N(7))-methyltransferase RsmG [Calditrichia bacterium]